METTAFLAFLTHILRVKIEEQLKVSTFFNFFFFLRKTGPEPSAALFLIRIIRVKIENGLRILVFEKKDRRSRFRPAEIQD